jgi:transcriptional regulator of NAD metabolism
MALDLDTLKMVQLLIADLNTTATFVTKLRESKEISFTISGITTKISAKDEEAFKPIFEAIVKSSDNKMISLRDRITRLLNSDDAEAAIKKEF